MELYGSEQTVFMWTGIFPVNSLTKGVIILNSHIGRSWLGTLMSTV